MIDLQGLIASFFLLSIKIETPDSLCMHTPSYMLFVFLFFYIQEVYMSPFILIDSGKYVMVMSS